MYGVTTKDYLKALILMAIPTVGLILAIIWAVNGTGTTEEWKTYFARAYLIYIGIITVIGIVLSVLLSGFFIMLASSMAGL